MTKRVHTIKIELTHSEERVLKYIFGMIFEHSPEFLKETFDLEEALAMSSFVKKIGQAAHEAGWCEDPDCSHKKN